MNEFVNSRKCIVSSLVLIVLLITLDQLYFDEEVDELPVLPPGEEGHKSQEGFTRHEGHKHEQDRGGHARGAQQDHEDGEDIENKKHGKDGDRDLEYEDYGVVL